MEEAGKHGHVCLDLRVESRRNRVIPGLERWLGIGSGGGEVEPGGYISHSKRWTLGHTRYQAERLFNLIQRFPHG